MNLNGKLEFYVGRWENFSLIMFLLLLLNKKERSKMYIFFIHLNESTVEKISQLLTTCLVVFCHCFLLPARYIQLFIKYLCLTFFSLISLFFLGLFTLLVERSTSF